jgi:hypothetical protein
VGHYDTYPAHDLATFAGCWGVFPYFPNSPGLFVASDIYRGLFVFELEVGAGRAAAAGSVASDPASAGLRLGMPSPNPVGQGPVRLALGPGRRAAVAALVVDAAGRRVRDLGLIEAAASGVGWDLRDDAGSRVPAGAYFVRVAGEDGVRGRKLIVGR